MANSGGALLVVPRVLTVGDGDLTLSLALSRAYGQQLNLTASTLLKSSQELLHTYANAGHVLQELEDLQVPIRYGVDATNLTEKWDAILFHHPHLGPIQEEEAHARRHFVLLAHYFHSARACLRPGGVVHVCLCARQPQTWRVMEAAQRQGLMLVKQESTSCPMNSWLSPSLEAAPVQPQHKAPRRYRNGKLGSKHFLGRYGYRHRRTHGEHGVGSDIDVSGSFHVVFRMTDEGNSVSQEQSLSPTECSVCDMVFESVYALHEHQKAPALPDLLTASTDEKSESNTRRNEPNDETFDGGKDTRGNEANDETVDGGKATPFTSSVMGYTRNGTSRAVTDIPIGQSTDMRNFVFSSVVDSAHDGKRVKWYLRQSSVNDLGLSKIQCEKMIKSSLVMLNGVAVVDSGRILRKGDRIAILAAPAGRSLETTTATAVKIHHKTDTVAVAYKPVGMRTIGSFSDRTLEMVISAQTGETFTSVSKLDTGCAGLCILQRNFATVEEVSHVFTALVHGHVPDDWNGLSVYLPIENMRRWQKGGDSDQGSLAEATVSAHHLSTGNECLDSSGKNGGHMSESCDGDGESVALHVLEKTRNNAETPALSTVRIVTSCKAGGLCSAVCFLLRKRGHPVVNDRLCRREYLTLPRSMRNLIKNRLCIGCYNLEFRVDLDELVTTVSVETPERLHALHWQRHCDIV
jgi:hypothetical protein